MQGSSHGAPSGSARHSNKNETSTNSSRRSSEDSPSGQQNTKLSITAQDAAAAEAEAKRRKVLRACDVCRRKKIRCEGPMTSSSTDKCANCQEYRLECTYVEAAKRRGPPKGLIEALEQRCIRLEKVLQQLHPTLNISSIVGPMPDHDEFDQGCHQDELRALGIPPLPSLKSFSIPPSSSHTDSDHMSPAEGAPSPSISVLGPSPWKAFERSPLSVNENESHNNEDGLTTATANESMCSVFSKLKIEETYWKRFHGQSSGAHLLDAVNQLKYTKPMEFLQKLRANSRPEYWRIPEWEVVISTEGSRPRDEEIWPDAELAQMLIDAYFTHVNNFYPLLNRNIFQKQFDSELYKTNHDFGRVCFMVFANGSRFVEDERVLWPTEVAMSDEGKQRLATDADGTLRYSAGWKYMRALVKMGKAWLQAPCLFDLQLHVLLCVFLIGSAVPHLTWLASGSGLRAAQEIGIHVRSTLARFPPIDRILYNRAFWCLYHIDRINCAAIGRSVAIQDTDFDVEYPLVVDDEYWQNDTDTFTQPEGTGVPVVSAFVHMLKLDHVLGAALRTIYAVNKLPEHKADPASQRAVVVELDSALNVWADSVPDGLRWDPTRADYTMFEQSAMLYAHYYYTQILIHRPFIPTPRTPESVVGFPSLAICTNAARSICNIIDAVLRRSRQLGLLPGRCVHINFSLPALHAAIILLINVFSGRQYASERERCINDIKRIIAALKDVELTWRQAGKLTDMLGECIREGDIPLPPPADTQHGQKRAHEPFPPTPNGFSNCDDNNVKYPLLQPRMNGDVGSGGSGTQSPSTGPTISSTSVTNAATLSSTSIPIPTSNESMKGTVNEMKPPARHPDSPPSIFGSHWAATPGGIYMPGAGSDGGVLPHLDTNYPPSLTTTPYSNNNNTNLESMRAGAGQQPMQDQPTISANGSGSSAFNLMAAGLNPSPSQRLDSHQYLWMLNFSPDGRFNANTINKNAANSSNNNDIVNQDPSPNSIDESGAGNTDASASASASASGGDGLNTLGSTWNNFFDPSVFNLSFADSEGSSMMFPNFVEMANFETPAGTMTSNDAATNDLFAQLFNGSSTANQAYPTPMSDPNSTWNPWSWAAHSQQ